MAKKRMTIEDLAVMVKKGFDDVDKRFDEMDKRFNEVDKRFDEMDKRFSEVDRHLTEVDKLLVRHGSILHDISEELDNVYTDTNYIREKNSYLVRNDASQDIEIRKIYQRLERLERKVGLRK